MTISLGTFQAMEETAYLRRPPANARHLLESIAELEAGNGAERGLTEQNSLCPAEHGELPTRLADFFRGSRWTTPSHL